MQALKHGSIGIEMGLSVVIGYGMGWWIDEKFETQPWFTTVFTVIGIFAGVRSMLQMSRRVARQLASEDTVSAEENQDSTMEQS